MKLLWTLWDEASQSAADAPVCPGRQPLNAALGQACLRGVVAAQSCVGAKVVDRRAPLLRARTLIPYAPLRHKRQDFT